MNYIIPNAKDETEPTIQSLLIFLGLIITVLSVLTAIDYLTVPPTHNPQTQCYTAEATGNGNFGFFIPLGWADTTQMLHSSPTVMYFCSEIDKEGNLQTSIIRPMPKDAKLINVPRYAQDPHDEILADFNQAKEDVANQQNVIMQQAQIMEGMYNAIKELEREIEGLKQPVN